MPRASAARKGDVGVTDNREPHLSIVTRCPCLHVAAVPPGFDAGGARRRPRTARILVERGRAAGVELEGGERIDAGSVVANADPHVSTSPPPAGARAGASGERRGGKRYSAPLVSLR